MQWASSTETREITEPRKEGAETLTLQALGREEATADATLDERAREGSFLVGAEPHSSGPPELILHE